MGFLLNSVATIGLVSSIAAAIPLSSRDTVFKLCASVDLSKVSSDPFVNGHEVIWLQGAPAQIGDASVNKYSRNLNFFSSDISETALAPLTAHPEDDDTITHKIFVYPSINSYAFFDNVDGGGYVSNVFGTDGTNVGYHTSASAPLNTWGWTAGASDFAEGLYSLSFNGSRAEGQTGAFDNIAGSLRYPITLTMKASCD